MAADILQHKSAAVTFDAPHHPASVPAPAVTTEFRLHFAAETPEDGRRLPALDELDEANRLEALRRLGELMDMLGSDTVRVLAFNLCQLRKELGQW